LFHIAPPGDRNVRVPSYMESKEILKYVKKNIKPLKDYDGSPLYRCSAILNDGIYLPCVAIKSAKICVDHVIKRFEETRKDKNLLKSVGYRSIVESFVCSGNRLNDYDVKTIDKSPYAIPVARMSEMGGETSMGWTEFTGVMDDGSDYCFGTAFHTMFFDMPEGYTAERLVKLIPAVRGELRKHDKVFREKPHFE
jgi:hypothetical protein